MDTILASALTVPARGVADGDSQERTSQKIVVYAAIIAIFIQAWAALRFSRSR